MPSASNDDVVVILVSVVDVEDVVKVVVVEVAGLTLQPQRTGQRSRPIGLSHVAINVAIATASSFCGQNTLSVLPSEQGSPAFVLVGSSVVVEGHPQATGQMSTTA